MHNLNLIPFFLVGPTIVGALVYWHHKWNEKKFYGKLEYLNDSPFPFHREVSGYEYVVFDLGNDTTLWCEYVLGIRSDGIYGLNYLKVKGLNEPHHRIKLKIGQSIFPIIENLNKFKEWAETKSFVTEWDAEFTHSWTDMKKKLDNLHYLETKSKEKEKKDK